MLVECPNCRIGFHPRLITCPVCRTYRTNPFDSLDYVASRIDEAFQSGWSRNEIIAMLVNGGVPQDRAREYTRRRMRGLSSEVRSRGLKQMAVGTFFFFGGLFSLVGGLKTGRLRLIVTGTVMLFVGVGLHILGVGRFLRGRG